MAGAEAFVELPRDMPGVGSRLAKKASNQTEPLVGLHHGRIRTA